MDIHTQSHLGSTGRVNLGSFYTPYKYVMLVKDWLVKYGLTRGLTIMDSTCGYGAFFELQDFLPDNTYIGNDIDPVAVKQMAEMFPNVRAYNINALFNVSRQAFGIAPDAKLVIVGNPPYNDVTSQINRKIKTSTIEIDPDIRTRDLGLSSLLSYDKLAADYVIILHPLSYLVKKTNWTTAKKFFMNYELMEHVVFNSQEFANTSAMNGFPVVIALYRRVSHISDIGLTYDKIYDLPFRAIGGGGFRMANWDYVTDYIQKYPHQARYSPEILFYTMRDINALKRNKTFISKRCGNAVDVDPAKLSYYCYIDCFKKYLEKNYIEVPYYLGNLNVPFNHTAFHNIEQDVLAISKHDHPDVFGKCAAPGQRSEDRVIGYIQWLLDK